MSYPLPAVAAVEQETEAAPQVPGVLESSRAAGDRRAGVLRTGSLVPAC